MPLLRLADSSTGRATMPLDRRRSLAMPRVHQQVGGLEIAVDQAALGGMLQAKGRLADVFAGLIDFERAVVAHQPGQIGAVDEFQGDVIGAVDLVGVISADDVRMAELPGGGGFRAENAGSPSDC